MCEVIYLRDVMILHRDIIVVFSVLYNFCSFFVN
jgi:hypothetical protein